MTSRRLLVSALAVLVLLLTGCATTPPAGEPTRSRTATSTPTPTPSATPTAGPVARLVIGPRELSTRDAQGRTIAAVPYSAGRDALVGLATSALGAPDGSDPGGTGGECASTPAAVWWGPEQSSDRFSVNTDAVALAPAPASWVVTRVADLDGISIQTASGAAIGSPGAPLEATIDAAAAKEVTTQVPEGGSDTRAFVAETAGTLAANGHVFGVSVITNGEVSIIAAPRATADVICGHS